MVVQSPKSATASSKYYLGPLIRDPQYEGEENMFPQQFRDQTPKQQEVVMGLKGPPFPLATEFS